MDGFYFKPQSTICPSISLPTAPNQKDSVIELKSKLVYQKQLNVLGKNS